MKELQLEFSAYREQAMKTERLLQDRLSQVEHDYSACRNESTEKRHEQKESERLLLDRLSNLEQNYSAYRNESMDFERRLQDQITQLKEEIAE